jgi:SAM-dependent methyltransferase
VSEPSPRSLTDRSFWEKEYYWGTDGGSRPYRVDPAEPFDRSLAGALGVWAPVAEGRRVLEIGCAPGKWLVFYAERFGAHVEGIEYSAKGAALAEQNLRLCQVRGTVHCADFFAFDPRPFDLVLSIGFIEHFTDLEGVFARHVEFLAPGGRLALGVPNFRGVNRALQALADREYLHRHNVRATYPALYRELASEHGLELERIGHIGGLDPSIIRLASDASPFSPRRLLPGLVTMAERSFRRTRLGERVQHPWASSYLLATFRRPG